MFKYLQLAFEIFKLIKGTKVKDAPKTVVIEAPTAEIATEIATKIGSDNPLVNIGVTTITQAGVNKLEDLITKKILK